MGGAMPDLEEARARLGAAARPLPPVEVGVREALGLRLAADVSATLSLPPADVSAMDGYAARAAELAAGAPLPVAFEVAAGQVPGPLPAGHAARIFTGAPLPVGADVVVQQELAERLPDGRVRLEPLPAGSNVRRRGEVVAEGDRVAAAGGVVTAQRLALLVAAGVDRVTVYPRPRLAVVGTGSELAAPDERPGPGRIRDSNGPLLDALARTAGLAPPRIARAPDRLEELVAALERALAAAEVVLTTGGVSVGDHDLVPEAARRLGAEVLFHRVAQKPGKPILAARAGERWLVGLPGNPLAVLVGWRLYVLPLVMALAGDVEAFREEPLGARLAAPAANRGARTVLRPARLEWSGGAWVATVLPWKGSHDLAAGGAADALVRLEPGAELPAGAEVRCYPL